MDTLQIVGIALIALGFADVPLALLVVGPRCAPQKRPVMMLAMGMGALVQVGLGIALLMGLFSN